MFLIAIIYLSAPVFIILFSFFNYVFVVPSALAIVIIVFCFNKQHLDIKDALSRSLACYWPLLLVSLLTSYSCVVIGFDTADWRNFFAIFNSLVENTWPPVIELDGQTWFLRYYLSWFIPSALFAKIFSSQFLASAMFVWTAIGIFIAMLLAFHKLNKTRHLFIAALVFFFFSGLDLVGGWLIDTIEHPSPYWLNWWGGYRLFAILSNLNTLQHAPQHAIAAYIATSLFFYHRWLSLQYAGLILVVTTMWSPFCAVGLLPIVAWALLKEGFKTALTTQNLLAAPLLAIPIVLYLTQGTEQIPFMFSWQHTYFSFISIILFCIFEFLLILGVLYYFLKEDRQIIFILAAFMTLLCTYNIGLYADLLIRGSMPAICVISILMIKSLLSNRGWRREVLVSYILIGAVPVIVAFVKGVSNPMPETYRDSTFKQYLTMRPAEDRDIHRSQNLVDIGSARHIGGVSLMRGLPSRVEVAR